MPRRIIGLSDTQVKTAKATGKEYKMADGGGLYLSVTPTGGKLWRMNYRHNGKSKTVSFGSYPSITLAEARQQRDEARKLISNNVDPSDIKKAKKAADTSKNQNSFEVVARTWHAGKVEGWAASHAKTTMDRLEKNIFPWLGAMPVTEIKLTEIKSVLHRIEERAPESARRMLIALNMIFRYCVASEFMDRSPLEGLKPKDILRREPIERHFPALTAPQELTALLRSIDDYKGAFEVVD